MPILDTIAPGGFAYGRNYVVEFEPDSCWYEASLTMVAYSLKQGIKTEYHTFQHIPDEVREYLGRMGLEVKRSEEAELLRIIDSYSVTARLSDPQKVGLFAKSLNLADWSIGMAARIRGEIPDQDKQWLHIDDNTGILLRYNDEKAFLEYFQTRFIPYARATLELVFHSITTGVASNSFYKEFESLCDGIIDFRTGEEGGEVKHYVRVRVLRGKSFDSRWRCLHILDDGEAVIDPMPVSTSEVEGLGAMKGIR